MPKMQVYLPEDLYRRLKKSGADLNVSAILQAALEEALAEQARRAALADVVAEYEGEHGKLTREELQAQSARDGAEARKWRKKRRRSKAA